MVICPGHDPRRYPQRRQDPKPELVRYELLTSSARLERAQIVNRRHVDPPPDVDGADDRPVVSPDDASTDVPEDEVVIDLRDNTDSAPLVDRRRPPSAVEVGRPALRVAIDVSATLDGLTDVDGQRLVVGLVSALADDDAVDLELLDGRSGQLRPLSRGQAQSFLQRLDQLPSGARRKLERRVAKTGLRARRWQPARGTWFVDLEPAWFSSMPRAELLPMLESAGVRTAAFVPDLDALHHPEWFSDTTATGFRQWLRAHRNAASTWLAASLTTADDLVYWLGPRSKNHDVRLLTLGIQADGGLRPSTRKDGSGRLVMVGAISIRGGHRLLLDALDLLGDGQPTIRNGPVVDVVGSLNGANEDLVSDLQSHPGIRLHDHLSGRELEQLWPDTSFLLAPRLGDGVGLAVVEALARSVPVVATNLAALAEVSQGLASALPPDPQRWAIFLAERLSHYPAAAARAARFQSTGWPEAASDLMRYLHNVDQKPRTLGALR